MWDAVPEGIRAMRTLLQAHGEDDAAAGLRAVLRRAQQALDNPPLVATRRPLTTRAYRALAGLNLEVRDVPRLLRDLAALRGDL